MKEQKPRDKLTQRMTHDGAVLDNQATGEEIHISGRDAEKQLSPNGQPVQMGKRNAPMNPAEDASKRRQKNHPQEQAKKPEQEPPQPQQANTEPFPPPSSRPVSHIPQDIPTSAAPGGTAEKLFDRAAAEHDAHKARQAARMSRDAAQQRYSASRLQFSEEERAAPEFHKHIHRAEKAADKLDAAQAAIPKKRVLRKERVFDEASGTAKTKLRFDTVDKAPPKLKPNPIGRPLREVAVQAHGKIHEVEHENVGVESGHKAEELAEHGIGGAIRRERRRRKLKPYRAAAKAERKAANAALCAFLWQLAAVQNAQTILLYAAFGSEADLSALAEKAQAQGKTLAYPVCGEAYSLTAAVPGPDGWEMGQYGIRTPILRRSEILLPEALDLVLVPCTAFDADCFRVGMGKGYYDRYLPRCKNAVKIGIAFEAQRVEHAAVDEHDQRLDAYVTERGIYKWK